jgi:hypothetical protein
MSELRYQYLHQSAYDKKININLRNSHALKKSNKKRPRSRYRDIPSKTSQFAPGLGNTIEVSQNFSMTKKKDDGLNYSVLGHSQFLNFKDEVKKQESDIVNEVPSQFFPNKRPKDYLDKVLNLEYPSPPRNIKSLSTPKYQPDLDLVEMVKNIFESKETEQSYKDGKAFTNIFEPSSAGMHKKTIPIENAGNMSFNYIRPKASQNFSLGRSMKLRTNGTRIDCTDVLQHIRQRQMYRKPLQLFQRN